jgi:hypothetical protein
MDTLGVRVAKWNMQGYDGKAILMGSKPWIKRTLNDAFGWLARPEVAPKTYIVGLTVRITDYYNFITGVEVIGDGTDFDRMTGWCCRRGLFVLEKAVYPLTDSRYLDVLEGLDVGASTTFWCD